MVSKMRKYHAKWTIEREQGGSTAVATKTDKGFTAPEQIIKATLQIGPNGGPLFEISC
jgi:hypothetical protein